MMAPLQLETHETYETYETYIIYEAHFTKL